MARSRAQLFKKKRQIKEKEKRKLLDILASETCLHRRQFLRERLFKDIKRSIAMSLDKLCCVCLLDDAEANIDDLLHCNGCKLIAHEGMYISVMQNIPI